MESFQSFEEAEQSRTLNHSWAAIGSFDGVHLGHQALLTPMIEQARTAGGKAVVVTFYPHPVEVLRGVNEPIYLTHPDERAQLLGELGIDVVVTLPFTRELAALSPEDFMGRLARAAGLRQLWVGHDFALGRNRVGDIPRLREIGEQMGFSVHVTDAVTGTETPAEDPGLDGETDLRISSSLIRSLIRQGKVAQAARMLGRSYSLEGKVVHGVGRGKQLGFPTANVEYWPKKIVPALGVYATWVYHGALRIPAVTSVGLNPTFTDDIKIPRVEAYLLDFAGDLYDQPLRVSFLEFLRPEIRFGSAQALIDQMITDTQNAREVFTHAA